MGTGIIREVWVGDCVQGKNGSGMGFSGDDRGLFWPKLQYQMVNQGKLGIQRWSEIILADPLEYSTTKQGLNWLIGDFTERKV
jgi:hypothetical protein